MAIRRKPKPDIALIRQCYSYNYKTGVFTHKRTLGRCKKGYRAGHVASDGYRQLCVDSKKYLEHHIAWLLCYGEWPDELDHKDRIKTNNAIKNLRKATRTQNNRNVKRKPRVSPIKGRHRARITVNYKDIHLGYFDTARKAENAYTRAATKYFGEFKSI